MTTLTIEVPDKEVTAISSYIQQKGGKAVKKLSVGTVKRPQQSSLKQGLTEAVLISQGKMKSTPLSELWDK